MTSNELRAEFQIMFEDLATAGSVGLNDYEMSVCLTKGQEIVVAALLKAKELGSLMPLISTIRAEKSETTATPYEYGNRFLIPTNSMAVIERAVKGNKLKRVGEELKEISEEIIGVEPVEAGKISKMYLSTYKFPPKNLAYVMVEENAETVFPPLMFKIKDYIVSYVKYPRGISLGNQVINGENLSNSLPSLNPPLHRAIVEAGVQFAISTYVGQPEKQVNNGASGN